MIISRFIYKVNNCWKKQTVEEYLIVASNNEEIPIEIDRDSSEWKVQFTLPEIGDWK